MRGNRKQKSRSHSLVTRLNEEVDKKCTEHINNLMEKPAEEFIKQKSKTVHKTGYTKHMHHQWRRLMLTRRYRGDGLKLKKSDLKKVNHSYAKTPLTVIVHCTESSPSKKARPSGHPFVLLITPCEPKT